MFGNASGGSSAEIQAMRLLPLMTRLPGRRRGTGCAQATAAGHACFYQRGSWSGLRQLDRPAILTLTDDLGETHQVVLSSIMGDKAALSIGGVEVVERAQHVGNINLAFQHTAAGRITNLFCQPDKPLDFSDLSKGNEI